MANFASTFHYQGRWTEAEKLFIQVMETWKTMLRLEYPNTLTIMANLIKLLHATMPNLS